MPKIKCPHCGYWQEPYRHVILCEKCYANIKEVIEEHFKGKLEEEPPEELKSDFLKWVWNAFNKQSRKARWRFLGPPVIFSKTLEISFKRFLTLYPLIFLSFLFFMLIGIFTSKIGAHIVYKMPEYTGPLNNSYNVNTSIAGSRHRRLSFHFSLWAGSLHLCRVKRRLWHQDCLRQGMAKTWVLCRAYFTNGSADRNGSIDRNVDRKSIQTVLRYAGDSGDRNCPSGLHAVCLCG